MMRLLAMTAVAVNAVELTPDNWDEKTAGKSVFIKFQAPWCGHCKKMKPDWDKLMKKFKKNDKVLVGDVDCTAAGQPLCESNGVQGYPTIKYGDPNSLEDYQGGRDMASLEKFAKGLKPTCSPFNMDLCEGDEKTKLEELMALSADDLTAKIEEEEKKVSEAESNFKSEVEKLQKKYESLSKEKEEAVAAVKAAGLGTMKSVQAFNAKKSGDKEEL